MKKQDANGVRIAQDLERKYRFQDIEVAEAQAKAAVSGLQAKLDTTTFDEEIEDLEDAIEDALEAIAEATEEAIEQIETSLENYVPISSELTEEDIEEIWEEDE